MCGIVGFQGGFPAELLRSMTNAVAHRGPDGEGSVLFAEPDQPRTGLGHRRLAIIDLSAAGCQPMTVAADAGGGMQRGLTLVFNGEIYNYRELRAELTAAGHRFTSATDSEVLLHLYERDGLGMLARLNGIFAFAIHDARAAGRPVGVARGSASRALDSTTPSAIWPARNWVRGPSAAIHSGTGYEPQRSTSSLPFQIAVLPAHSALTATPNSSISATCAGRTPMFRSGAVSRAQSIEHPATREALERHQRARHDGRMPGHRIGNRDPRVAAVPSARRPPSG